MVLQKVELHTPMSPLDESGQTFNPGQTGSTPAPPPEAFIEDGPLAFCNPLRIRHRRGWFRSGENRLNLQRLQGRERESDSPFTSVPVREEMMGKYSNLSSESHNISLTEHSSMPVEKNITLESSSIITLTCQYTTLGNLNSINVTWKKDDELLKNFSLAITGNTLYTEYTTTVINSKQMGSYSCLFEDEKEQRGTFNIKVPELHGKNKPLITYVGDSTVLVCKCQHCYPLHWTWYRSNGSIQVPIDVHTKEKYVVSGAYRNETKLKIKHLLEEDGGSYWCHAVFQLGESEEQLELVVLSFLVPLKPFLAIIAEAVVLVAVILLCEVYTQKKKKHPDEGKEFEQIEQLKSDDSNGIENNAPRQRKNESVSQ
ncbi:embigin [Fukomys damarensis]|uniref:embigin n=1 Tax=Fukomys damarensis TaxID=885580 RepID=UPI0014550F67|nr:embigin [Fukomys damarensis]